MSFAKSLPNLASILTDQERPLIHRDISWLQFNDRVLAEARQKANPLLERLKFLAISSTNLDEFFMIRFASLHRQISASRRQEQENKAKELERIESYIIKAALRLREAQGETLDELTRELKPHGIVIDREPGAGKLVFDENVLPHLIPPEPFQAKLIQNLGNLQMALVFPGAQPESRWALVPKSLPSVFWDGSTIHFLDDLLLSHAAATFNLTTPPLLLRLTRDGDYTPDLEEEDTESIPDVIRKRIGVREKGRVVRLQYQGTLAPALRAELGEALRLNEKRIIPAPQTLCLQGLLSITKSLPESLAQNPALAYPPVRSLIPRPFQKPETLFDRLKKRDLLLHHPYDSFDAFTAWIQAACQDPEVTEIEMAIYRSDAVSPVLSALKSAAQTKKIRVIIELRARFDELNNLRLAEELRQAGVAVAFGFGKLKLHAKVALITRVEQGAAHYYTHLSTGNYNSVTARQYTDLAILTAHPGFGEDARYFFDQVWKGQIPTSFKWLVSAPTKLHRLIQSQIQAETENARKGQKARIVAKVNALVDESIIEKLYEASSAGVQVDLIVRGACSLVPGVKDLSENIRVVSVVDRFLEHSRIYFFESAKAMYLSSADWMPRNFFSRLELAFPVLDSHLYRYLEEVVIPTYLSDTAKARELTSEGSWKARARRGENAPVRSQFAFQELAENEYRGTPIADR